MWRFLKKVFLAFLVLGFVALLAGAGVAAWGIRYVTRDLPDVKSINDYRPSAVTKVYANDGTIIAEFFKERRYPMKLSQIPTVVKQAFLAAEDASFYRHPGIDPWSILRAFVKNLQAGAAKQGASTITQQVVKNLLLTPERRLERKIKEAVLSYRLEEALTKDEIFEVYLNQIFLGNTAYGVAAASLAYFNKPIDQITLAEASLIAGLPKAPSKFSPVSNMPRAKRRQRYVLDQMVRSKFITKEEADQAFEEKIKVFQATQQNIYAAPYFVGEVRRNFLENFKNYDLDQDGLEIKTTVDLKATKFGEKALRKGLRAVDKRRGFRGVLERGVPNDAYLKRYAAQLPETLEDDEVYPALVLAASATKGTASVLVKDRKIDISLRDATWAKKKIDQADKATFIKPEAEIKVGDVIEVAHVTSTDEKSKEVKVQWQLDQTPQIEGALTLLEPSTGKVLVMLGGYSYQRSVLNRVTQSLRQPGSTFKPVVYLSAVDGYKYTASTIVHDSPRTIKVGDQLWSPGNYDNKYMGPITLRTALEKSKNLVSVDIISRIGITPVIKYARDLGITTPLGRNPSLALGSSEVTLLELTRAYGVFAARGMLADSYLVEQIKDRTGAVVYDREAEFISHIRQAISPSSAFIMANIMKGVIQSGTATAIKPINRPVAGKTGTTNDMMDAWFIGYTPEWVCGIWTGFDQLRSIGDKETGGRIAAPIFLNAMKPFLEYRDEVQYAELEKRTKEDADRLHIEYRAPEKIQPLDFQPTDDVIGMWVNKGSGRPVSGEEPGAIYEYFIKGTEPQAAQSLTEDTQSYLDSPDL
jgi:penicillin-binding protein 1A